MTKKNHEKKHLPKGRFCFGFAVTFSRCSALPIHRQKQKQDRMPEQLWSGYAILTFSDQTWTSTESTMVLGKGV